MNGKTIVSNWFSTVTGYFTDSSANKAKVCLLYAFIMAFSFGKIFQLIELVL